MLYFVWKFWLYWLWYFFHNFLKIFVVVNSATDDLLSRSSNFWPGAVYLKPFRSRGSALSNFPGYSSSLYFCSAILFGRFTSGAGRVLTVFIISLPANLQLNFFLFLFIFLVQSYKVTNRTMNSITNTT